MRFQVDTYHAEMSRIMKTADGRRIAAICRVGAHGVQYTGITMGMGIWLGMWWAAAIARLHLRN